MRRRSTTKPATNANNSRSAADEDATDTRQHGSTDALSKHGRLSKPRKPTHPHAEEHVPSEVFLRAPPLEDLGVKRWISRPSRSDSNGAPRMAVTTAISMNQRY